MKSVFYFPSLVNKFVSHKYLVQVRKQLISFNQIKMKNRVRSQVKQQVLIDVSGFQKFQIDLLKIGDLKQTIDKIQAFNLYLDDLLCDNNVENEMVSNQFSIKYLEIIKDILKNMDENIIMLCDKFIDIISIMILIEKIKKLKYIHSKQEQKDNIDIDPLHNVLQKQLNDYDYVNHFQQTLYALSDHPAQQEGVFNQTFILLLINQTRTGVQYCLSQKFESYNNPQLSSTFIQSKNQNDQPNYDKEQIIKSLQIIGFVLKFKDIDSLNMTASILRIMQFLQTQNQNSNEKTIIDKNLLSQLLDCLNNICKDKKVIQKNNDRLINCIYIIIFLNTHKINQQLYMKQTEIIQNIVNNLQFDQLNLKNLQSILYSINRDSFINENLKNQIQQVSSKQYLEKLKHTKEFMMFYLRLIKCGVQLKILDVEYFKNNITFIQEQIKRNEQFNFNNQKVFIIDLCIRFLQTGFNNHSLYEIIFDELDSYLNMEIKNVYKLYYLFFIMRTYKDQFSLIIQQKLDNPKLISKFEQSKQQIKQKIPKQQHQSLQEFEIAMYLKNMNIEFIEEKEFFDLIYVDFYLPKYNVVIELQGPFHFLKQSNELNLSSEFRIKLLQKLNLNVIQLNYYDKSLSSQQQQLLTKLYKYIKLDNIQK